MEVWATAAPLLCAVHCIAMPLVVAFAPRLAAFQEHERALMAGALVLALATTVLGIRVHRRASPLLLVAAGALAWGATFLALPLPGELPTVTASLLMAGGTLWSARLRHLATCPRCGCGASGESAASGRPSGGEAVR
jgi:hypothetical protein